MVRGTTFGFIATALSFGGLGCSAPADEAAIGSAGQALITGTTLPSPIIVPTTPIQAAVPRLLVGRVGTDGLAACADIVGRQGRWTATRLDGWTPNNTTAPPATVLAPFCILEWKGTTGTTGAPESRVLPSAVVTNVARYADAPVVAPTGAWLGTSASWTRLRDAALVGANRASLPMGWAPAYVGVVDSSPDDFTSCDAAAGRYDHGEAIGRFIRVASGTDGAPCGKAVSVYSALGLPRDETGLVNAAGGSYGYLSDVALAASRLLRAWNAVPNINVLGPNAVTARMAPPPRVLNLSVAWDDANRSIGQNARDAVRAVLQVASCRGVLTFAAAGNSAGAASEAMLAPASWQNSDAAPDAAACTQFGVPRVNMPAPGASSRLVYAVGAVDGRDALVFNARAAGTPRLVAYGDEVVMPRKAGLATAFTLPKTGTSMGTALVSAVAAGAWAYAPSTEAGALVERIYALATKLTTATKTATATSCGPFTTGCTLARVDFCKVVGGFAGSTACTPRAPFAGVRVGSGAVPATVVWSVGTAGASTPSTAALVDSTATAPAVRPQPGSSNCGLCAISGSTAYLSLSNPASSATLKLTTASGTTSQALTLSGASSDNRVSLGAVPAGVTSATITFTGVSGGSTWTGTDSVLFF